MPNLSSNAKRLVLGIAALVPLIAVTNDLFKLGLVGRFDGAFMVASIFFVLIVGHFFGPTWAELRRSKERGDDEIREKGRYGIEQSNAIRISESSNYFVKWLLPFVVFCAFAIVVVVSDAPANSDETWVTFAVLSLLFAVFFVTMKKTVWKFADKVLDAGEEMIVEFRGRIDHVPLANVAKVSVERESSAKIVQLKLKKPCRFGENVFFRAKQSDHQLGQGDVVDSFILRLERMLASRV